MEIIKLNLIPNGVNPVCHASQYDNGRVIRGELFDGLTPYTLASGDVVALNVRKPDNHVVTATLTATAGNSYVDIVMTEQMTACFGENLCELKITNGNTEIGTINFYMIVERDVLANGDPSQSVIEDLDALVEEAVGDNYYTKSEVDSALALKADASDVYGKSEVDEALAFKADTSSIDSITNKMELVKSENLFDKNSVSVGFVYTNGYIGGDVNYRYSRFIKVNAGDVLRSYYKPSGIYPVNMAYICAYDSNKNAVSESGAISVTEYTVPEGVEYIVVSFLLALYETAMIIVYDEIAPDDFIPYFEPYYIATQDFVDKVLSDLDVRTGLISKDKTDFWQEDKSDNLFNVDDITEDEYYYIDGTIAQSNSMFRSLVKISGAGQYSFKVCGLWYGLTNAFKIPTFDKDGLFVKTLTATTSEVTATDTNSALLTIGSQDISDGVAYIGYSEKKSLKNNLMVVKSSSYPSEYIPYYDRWLLPDLYIDSDENQLKGKIAVFDGDSICAGIGSAMGDYGDGWAGRIGVKNKMSYHNVGVGGATITAETYSGQTPRHWVSRSIDTIYQNYPNADYIILEGGTNDADNFYNTPEKLGTFDETDFTGPFDDTTFYGAMDSLCKKALTYFPKAKIGFIVAHKMGKGFTSYTKNRNDYFTYASRVCKKWGIPVLNLWEDGQLRPDLISMYDPTYNTIETATEHGLCYYDGQHLTAYGYDVISPKIEAFMKSL